MRDVALPSWRAAQKDFPRGETVEWDGFPFFFEGIGEKETSGAGVVLSV